MLFFGYYVENNDKVHGGFSVEKNECEILGHDTDGWTLLVKYRGHV